ncbi:hypothetical protein MMC15_004904 [Xylographa vitiligo]|nr:hypothetical protein [Xylographa vitiligo]
MTCVDGVLRRLDETVFPTPELLKVCAKFDIQLPFIKVDKLEDKGWIHLLEPLGVGMKATVDFYVQALRRIKEIKQVDKAQALKVYQALAENHDQSALRKPFLQEDLILIWSVDSPRWIGMSTYVWKAPPGLRSKIALSHIWPENEQFFHRSLGVQNATLAIGELRTTVYLPIQSAKSGPEVSWTSSNGNFFIADREYLHDIFTGKVPILDFSVDEAYKLHKIFNLLNLRCKHLSYIVKENYNPSDFKELDSRLRANFRSKVIALARCAQHWRPDQTKKNTIKKQSELLGFEVFRVSKITLRRYLTHQGQTIWVESEGNLQFVSSADGLNLYLPAEEAKLQLVNHLFLPEAFAEFLGIPDHSLFIGAILHSDQATIDTLLDHKGIPKIRDEERVSMGPRCTVDGSTEQPLGGNPFAPSMTASTHSEYINDPTNIVPKWPDPTLIRGGSPTIRMSTNRWGRTNLATNLSGLSLELRMANVKISGDDTPTTEAGLYSPIAAPLSNDLMIRDSKSTEFPAESTSLLDIAKHKPPKRKGKQSRATRNAPKGHINVSAARDFETGLSGRAVRKRPSSARTPSQTSTRRTGPATSRAFANPHPDHHGFEVSDAPEVSDFAYEDKLGSPTTFLVGRGHEEPKAWLAQPPAYCLEAKATAEGSERAPLSTSNWQA